MKRIIKLLETLQCTNIKLITDNYVSAKKIIGATETYIDIEKHHSTYKLEIMSWLSDSCGNKKNHNFSSLNELLKALSSYKF